MQPAYFLRAQDGRRVAVRESVTVGRLRDCDVCIDDERVSRAHCRVVFDADGLRVVDGPSYNGTFVNGARVTESARLRPGDALRVADVTLTVEPAEGAAFPQFDERLVFAEPIPAPEPSKTLRPPASGPALK